MKSPLSAIFICLAAILLSIPAAWGAAGKPDQKIFVWGDDIRTKFVQYVAELTGKENPRICYVPTASGDSGDNIKYWEFICGRLSIEPHVLKVWVSSTDCEQTFAEILLGMDAIVVGGGNTLNMMGIWKAQGIDRVMREALERGIILAGGSAGSICWFTEGLSDSRPVELSMVGGLGILPYSNCPHYARAERKTMYRDMVKNRTARPGYALDDMSGILFVNGKPADVIRIRENDNAYFVGLKKGLLWEEKLESRYYLDRNALPEDAYTAEALTGRVGDHSVTGDWSTPMNAFHSLMDISINKRNSQLLDASVASLAQYLQGQEDASADDAHRERYLNAELLMILQYGERLAAVVYHIGDMTVMRYIANEGGRWLNAGEDLAGDTLADTEVVFREKAGIILNR